MKFYRPSAAAIASQTKALQARSMTRIRKTVLSGGAVSRPRSAAPPAPEKKARRRYS